MEPKPKDHRKQIVMLTCDEALVAVVAASGCIAGSTNGYSRRDEECRAAPRISGSFPENKCDGTLAEQFDNVCDYVSR